MTTKQEILLTIEEMINHLYFMKTQVEHLEVAKSEKKLTGFLDGKPSLVGEYEAIWHSEPLNIQRRWWNGECWSMPYYDFWNEESKNNARRFPQPKSTPFIRYRGFTTKQE